jgi:hypothetical protein
MLLSSVRASLVPCFAMRTAAYFQSADVARLWLSCQIA